SMSAKIWSMLAINLVASAFYFGLIGNKGPLFMLPVFLLLNYMLQRKYIIVYIFLIMSSMITAFTLCFEDQTIWVVHDGNSSGLFDFASAFERRALILPAWLNDVYVKYFSDGKLYWAYSRLSLGLVEQTLPDEPANTIGYYLSGREM